MYLAHFDLHYYYLLLFFVAKLDPNRPSRKFSQPKQADEPDNEVKDKMSARWERLNALGEENADEIALEKKKAQRLEAARLAEEKYNLIIFI